MRFDVIALILGWMLVVLSAPLAVSMLLGMALGDGVAAMAIAFLPAIALSGGGGWLLLRRGTSTETVARMRDREAFAAVALGWPVAVLVGAIPYWLGNMFHGPFGEESTFFESMLGLLHAWFESMSGFTTTGATVIDRATSPVCIPFADSVLHPDFDCIYAQARGLLLWRSSTQWLGGMGIIMLSMLVLARVLGGGMTLALAELTGPSLARLKPRIQETAKVLWTIYIVLTIAEAILLLIAGMDLFDAVNHALTTMPTGGFSTHDTNIGHYDSLPIELILIVFMLLAGVNFSLLHLAWLRQWLSVRRDEELRLYLLVLVSVSAIIGFDLWIRGGLSPGDGFRQAVFQAVSIGSSTGFASVDFTFWPILSLLLLLFMMTIGASAGSTGGGVKHLRVILAWKFAAREIRRILTPRQIIPIRLNKEVIDEGRLGSILGMLAWYVVLLISSTLALAMFEAGLDVESVISLVASSLGNTGPALGRYGPSMTWAGLTPMSLIVTSLLMWAGRLEILTVLVLAHGRTWKR